MDTPVTVHIIATVLVADWHERPAEAAAELVRSALASAMRPVNDWGGAFAIIPDDQRLVINAPHSSD
jgi:hypothetical protein